MTKAVILCGLMLALGGTTACATGNNADDAGAFDAALPSIDAAPGSVRVTSSSSAGGVQARSPNYKLVGTVNMGGGNAASPNYKLRGGVVGSSQP